MPGSEQVLQGKTQLFFSTNPAPEGMVCHVQPSSGFEVHTHFSIFCTSGKEVFFVFIYHLVLYYLVFEQEWIFLITVMHLLNMSWVGSCAQVHSVFVGVSSGYLPLFKSIQIGYAKLPLCVNECQCVYVCTMPCDGLESHPGWILLPWIHNS